MLFLCFFNNWYKKDRQGKNPMTVNEKEDIIFKNVSNIYYFYVSNNSLRNNVILSINFKCYIFCVIKRIAIMFSQ